MLIFLLPIFILTIMYALIFAWNPWVGGLAVLICIVAIVRDERRLARNGEPPWSLSAALKLLGCGFTFVVMLLLFAILI